MHPSESLTRSTGFSSASFSEPPSTGNARRSDALPALSSSRACDAPKMTRHAAATNGEGAVFANGPDIGRVEGVKEGKRLLCHEIWETVRGFSREPANIVGP